MIKDEFVYCIKFERENGMKDILVSIVIPIYNRTSDLEVLLTSIINNEYRNYEVIIVDNASTENITYVIDKYKMDIHYIRLNENKMAAG